MTFSHLHVASGYSLQYGTALASVGMLGVVTLVALLAPTLAKARVQLKRIATDYGLDVDPDAIVEDLSVGHQQRVEILKVLLTGARPFKAAYRGIGAFDPAPAARAHDQLGPCPSPVELVGVALVVVGQQLLAEGRHLAGLLAPLPRRAAWVACRISMRSPRM